MRVAFPVPVKPSFGGIGNFNFELYACFVHEEPDSPYGEWLIAFNLQKERNGI
jgi:hypothetical protein